MTDGNIGRETSTAGVRRHSQGETKSRRPDAGCSGGKVVAASNLRLGARAWMQRARVSRAAQTRSSAPWKLGGAARRNGNPAEISAGRMRALRQAIRVRDERTRHIHEKGLVHAAASTLRIPVEPHCVASLSQRHATQSPPRRSAVHGAGVRIAHRSALARLMKCVSAKAVVAGENQGICLSAVEHWRSC